MKKIYTDYFQKSKVFLYPLLGIKKGIRFVPIETYLSWEGLFGIDKNKFFCLYRVPEGDEEYKMFEVFKQLHLKTNEHFEDWFPLKKHSWGDDQLLLCQFDFDIYKKDLKRFKKGKYSQFSEYIKKRILDFFGDVGTITEYVESYLYPEYFYDIYSELLNVPVNVFKEVGELCDKPNLHKEMFVKEMVEMKLFK